MDVRARLGIGDAAILERGQLPPYADMDPETLQIPDGSEGFCPREALHGSSATAELTSQVPNGFWVSTPEGAECIRIYQAGFGEVSSHQVAMVYLSGDVILRTAKGARLVSTSYGRQSPAALTAQMEDWSSEAGVPAVFLARPGIFGSSGCHEKRRHPQEIALVSGALDQISRCYGVERFILVGQSGGALIAAAMLARRRDIAAVVLTGGLLSVHRTVRWWRRTRPVPGGARFKIVDLHDPIAEVAQIPPDATIWLVSDPRDTVVPFGFQLQYLRALRAHGHRPEQVFAHASGPKRHYLAAHGRCIAGLLARSLNSAEIRAALVALDVANIDPQHTSSTPHCES